MKLQSKEKGSQGIWNGAVEGVQYNIDVLRCHLALWGLKKEIKHLKEKIADRSPIIYS